MGGAAGEGDGPLAVDVARTAELAGGRGGGVGPPARRARVVEIARPLRAWWRAGEGPGGRAREEQRARPRAGAADGGEVRPAAANALLLLPPSRQTTAEATAVRAGWSISRGGWERDGRKEFVG